MDEEAIFTKAITIESLEDRAAFLHEACGNNSELRSSVEQLLKLHVEAGNFLESPAIQGPATEALDSTTADKEDRRQAALNSQTVILDEISIDFLSPSEKPDCLGRLGTYEITAIVGRGGMGVVLKGRDPELNRVVAIKVLAPELASNSLARKRFLREARAAAAISHDHVVTIHAINQTGQLPHLAMEYVDGQSLQQRLDRSGPLGLKEILRIGKQTAAGLAAAHAEGLIHRDIKPANILLENGIERVKITDFGLARAVDDVSLTQSGVVAGTPQYMSPEQAQSQRVDHRADLFSLGSVLYAMCTGRPPFRADSTIAVIRRVCDDTPRPIQQVNPDVPGWLVVIIDKLLAKDPNQRFESATELAELLGQHLAHIQQPSLVPQPVPLLQTSDGLEPGNASRRSTAKRWAAAAILVSVLFGGLSFTEATGRTQITSTVIRIVTGEGTLVVEVDDPSVSVQIDGEELIITGAGVREVRVRPGEYRIHALKNGKPVHQELVTIARNGRQVVKINLVPLAQTGPPAVQSSPTMESAEPVMQITRAKRRFTGELADSNYGIAISPDGKRALTGGDKGQLCLWDIETGRELRRFLGVSRVVQSVAISPDGRYGLSSSHDPTIRLWDLETGKQVRQFKGHTGFVRRVVFSPDGRLIFSSSADHDKHLDNTLRLWDVQTGRELRRLEGFAGPLNDIAFSPDGKRVAGADDQQIFVWNVKTGRLVQRFILEATLAFRLAFSPDGRFLVSGHRARSKKDGKWYDPEHCVLKLWNVQSGRVLRTFRGHTGPIQDVAFSPDGRHILSASSGGFDGSKFIKSDDNSIRLWDVATGVELVRYLLEEDIRSIAFAPDDRTFLSAGRSTVRLWDVPPTINAKPQPLTEVRRFTGHTRMVSSVAVSPGGRFLLSAAQGGVLLLSNLETGKAEKTFAGHARGVSDVSFGRDGTAFSCSVDQTARRWDVSSGQEIRRYVGHTGWVSALTVSPDGKHLVTGSIWYASEHQGIPQDNSLRLWDVEIGKEVRRFEDVLFAIKGVAFAPDGKSIVAGGENSMLGLWDVETGKRIRRFTAPTSVRSVAFSPEGTQVASSHVGGLKDGKFFDPEHFVIILWDVKSGGEIRRLRGHTAMIHSIAFSPDGRLFASAAGAGIGTGGWHDAHENTVRIWDVATGEELARAELEIAVQSVAFTPDGRHVVTGGGRSGKPGQADIRLWRLPESVWPETEKQDAPNPTESTLTDD